MAQSQIEGVDETFIKKCKLNKLSIGLFPVCNAYENFEFKVTYRGGGNKREL